jgi:hypothetical protein
MRNLLLALCLFAAPALAVDLPGAAPPDTLPTFKFQLVTGLSLMTTRSLRGLESTAIAAHVGTAFLHVNVNGTIYDGSVEALSAVDVAQRTFGGGAACVAPHASAAESFCLGLATVIVDSNGRGLVGGWQWKDHLLGVASLGLHF